MPPEIAEKLIKIQRAITEIDKHLQLTGAALRQVAAAYDVALTRWGVALTQPCCPGCAGPDPAAATHVGGPHCTWLPSPEVT